MLWKLLGLQRLFDELFDETWRWLDLPGNDCFSHEEFTAHRQRRIDAMRWLMLCGLVGCGMAWGLVELFALQRARYHAWRDRQQTALPH